MTVPDTLDDIRTLLLADAAVAAATSSRVFSGELPEEESRLMPRAAVVVSPAGGPGRQGTTKYRRTRVDTTCYGATLHESWQVHLAVREALETLSRRDNSLISLEMTSDGALARDPLKQWPTCYASYRLLSPISV